MSRGGKGGFGFNARHKSLVDNPEAPEENSKMNIDKQEIGFAVSAHGCTGDKEGNGRGGATALRSLGDCIGDPGGRFGALLEANFERLGIRFARLRTTSAKWGYSGKRNAHDLLRLLAEMQ